MKTWQRIKTLGLLIATSSLLIACGTFQIYVEQAGNNLQPSVTFTSPTTTPEQKSHQPTETITSTTVASIPSKTKIQAGQPIKIVSIKMIEPTIGWAIGQSDTGKDEAVLYTTDGGLSWQDRTPPDRSSSQPDNPLATTAFFSSATLAWAVIYPQNPAPPSQDVIIWSTSDGGKTWRSSQPLDLGNIPVEVFLVSELGFFDEYHGWLLAHLGAGMSHDYIAIFTTTDGGLTWNRIVDPEKNQDMMACSKTGLAFVDDHNGWLAGNCPGLMDTLFIYRTTNAGLTWKIIDLPVPTGQPADLFKKGDNGCGIPDLIFNPEKPLILNLRCTQFSTNQVTNWLYTYQDLEKWTATLLPAPFGQVQFSNLQDGWFIGTLKNDPEATGEVFHTQNGGKTWQSVLPVGWQGMPAFLNNQSGWVVARLGNKTALVKTPDGGITWKEIKPVTVP